MSPDPNVTSKLYDEIGMDLKSFSQVNTDSSKDKPKSIQKNYDRIQISNVNFIMANDIVAEVNSTNEKQNSGLKSNDALMQSVFIQQKFSTHASDNSPDPTSPSSSSSTSQANDITFEPTVEMMVNDFDDEQTLNEEEALAALESQDPQDEIDTLKAESEIPLEELLAKYQTISPLTSVVEPIRKKFKKSSKSKQKCKPKINKTTSENFVENTENKGRSSGKLEEDKEVILIESGDERDLLPVDEQNDIKDEMASSDIHSISKASIPTIEQANFQIGSHLQQNNVKVRHTYLMDLYPAGTFDNVVNNNVVDKDILINDLDIPLEMLYDVEEDEDEELEEDDDFKKKVMIGPNYQAIIPVGLSQYGDILPYENEDKLIWEPSQVGESKVEEYLIKVRDIKSNITDEDDSDVIDDDSGCIVSQNDLDVSKSLQIMQSSLLKNKTISIDYDLPNGVIKDNEQALHLLVQCGYDFKEALRRKRLNALPLSDSMSLWSEEECQKFEEGIQKYGKDFLKIRQNQVRTRTMRELVQFYYLWKKSERRDHNFANADTVDHMDMYLNEDNDYGNSNATPSPCTTDTTNVFEKNNSVCIRKSSENSSIKKCSHVSDTRINADANNSQLKNSILATANPAIFSPTAIPTYNKR